MENQAGWQVEHHVAAGKRWGACAIRPSASSGCRYINSPSAVMNTPLEAIDEAIQQKSSADCAHTEIRGEPAAAASLAA